MPSHPQHGHRRFSYRQTVKIRYSHTVGKGKRGKRASRELAVVTPTPMAERHTFSYGGLLGHDLSASEWTINVSEQTALSLDVVQACVQIIADGVADSDVGQWNGTTRIDPPSGFTLRPDPDMTRRDFLWLFAANLALYRAVWVEEATVAGQVVGVRLHCIQNVNRVGSDLYVGGQLIRNRMKLVRRSVWPTLDVETGATLALAREVFAGAMAANAYQSDYWQQGGSPVLILKTEQPITSDQASDIQARWVEQRTTSPGKPAVLGFGADAKPIGADLGQTGVSTNADKQRASMARYFQMPPTLVNVMTEASSLHYSTDEQVGIHLARYTIRPYNKVIGEALSAYLPGDYLLGDRIVLDANYLTIADQATRYGAWAVALGIAPGMTGQGWMTLEEVREAENLPPNGDLQIIPTVNTGAASVRA